MIDAYIGIRLTAVASAVYYTRIGLLYGKASMQGSATVWTIRPNKGRFDRRTAALRRGFTVGAWWLIVLLLAAPFFCALHCQPGMSLPAHHHHITTAPDGYVVSGQALTAADFQPAQSAAIFLCSLSADHDSSSDAPYTPALFHAHVGMLPLVGMLVALLLAQRVVRVLAASPHTYFFCPPLRPPIAPSV
jgi:hypothetical protein